MQLQVMMVRFPDLNGIKAVILEYVGYVMNVCDVILQFSGFLGIASSAKDKCVCELGVHMVSWYSSYMSHQSFVFDVSDLLLSRESEQNEKKSEEDTDNNNKSSTVATNHNLFVLCAVVSDGKRESGGRGSTSTTTADVDSKMQCLTGLIVQRYQ